MEAAAEEVAFAAVFLVEGGGVFAVEQLHAGGELRDGCFEDQVVVVGHQAVGVHGPAVEADAEFEHCQEGEPVVVVANDAQVVVMDVSMPGIDGLEATRRLRQVKPDVAVIILSGTADYADAARAAGAAGYLTKGRVHDEVVDAILSAAGHHADDLPDGDGLPR